MEVKEIEKCLIYACSLGLWVRLKINYIYLMVIVEITSACHSVDTYIFVERINTCTKS